MDYYKQVLKSMNAESFIIHNSESYIHGTHSYAVFA